MQILDLQQAADFLKMNPEVLRRKAKRGLVPGRKAGKCWVFVREHLADWVSGRYPDLGRELRVVDGGKQQQEVIKPCQSINVVKVKSGGFNSSYQTANEYNALLGRK